MLPMKAILLLAMAASPVNAAGPVLPYPVVDTGQTTCYDNRSETAAPSPGQPFAGQDAQHQGVQPAYQDHGDGTVTDLNTGLMWQKKPADTRSPWNAAQTVPKSLRLGGHDDWRLPSLKELYSLMDYGKGWPYIDTKYFDCALAANAKATQFWTSNKYVAPCAGTQQTGFKGVTERAFGVNFATGHIKGYPIEMGNYVRCVRGNPAYGKNDFVDNADQTITDRATGLTWSKDDSKKGLDWQEALAWAQAKNKERYLGHDDWRLPNIKELQSLVDYTRSPGATDPAINGPAINPLFHCTPITNENKHPDYPFYWSSTSARPGQDSTQLAFAWYVAFGRAGGSRSGADDIHGAGAVRFDTKVKGGPAGEGGERIYNYVRLVYGGPATTTRPVVTQTPAAKAPAPASSAPTPSNTNPQRLPSAPIIMALDSNGDGIIDADELAKAAEALKALDKNHDGKLTPDEYRPQMQGRPGGGGGPQRQAPTP